MFIVISIHALRVEGDAYPGTKCVNKLYFYPRPPGGGRRCRSSCRIHHQRISIHALRVEGDLSLRHQAERSYISIHALRVEGDATSYSTFISSSCNFYPRPPGGGRPLVRMSSSAPQNFYPRPPGGGRPWRYLYDTIRERISIHALRVEGDAFIVTITGVDVLHFYPRPPGGGRPRSASRLRSTLIDFYPRPPGGGRLHLFKLLKHLVKISIHALRVEGDT